MARLEFLCPEMGREIKDDWRLIGVVSMVLSAKAFVYKKDVSAERPGIEYTSFPDAKAPIKTPSLLVTLKLPPPSAVAMEEQPSPTPPPAPAQPDGAIALPIDTSETSVWVEEMEEATPDEEFVKRKVKFMEEESTIPTTRKVLILETASVSIKDRLGVRGGQRYPPGPRPAKTTTVGISKAKASMVLAALQT